MFRKLLLALFILALAVPATAQGGARGKSAKSPTVYLTRTGKRYHASYCSSLRKSSRPISLRDALSRGFAACSLCGGSDLEITAPTAPAAPAAPAKVTSLMPPFPSRPVPKDGAAVLTWSLEELDKLCAHTLATVVKPSVRTGAQRAAGNVLVANNIQATQNLLGNFRRAFRETVADPQTASADCRHTLRGLEAYEAAGRHIKAYMATGSQEALAEAQQARTRGRIEYRALKEVFACPIPAEEL